MAKRIDDKMPCDLQKSVRGAGLSDTRKLFDQTVDDMKKRKPNPIAVTSDRGYKARLNEFAKNRSARPMPGLERRG